MQSSTSTQQTPRRRAGRRRLLVVMVALVVSLFVLFLEDGTPARAIVGGTEVLAGKYPFMVAVFNGFPEPSRPPKHFLCGGTLIDKDSVLTAAHCIQGTVLNDQDVHNIYVLAGTNGYLGPGRQAALSEASTIWVHGGFNLDPQSNDKKYDAAVINLQHQVAGFPGHRIRRIRLATKTQDFLEKPGRKATVAGWGYTKNGGGALE